MSEKKLRWREWRGEIDPLLPQDGKMFYTPRDSQGKPAWFLSRSKDPQTNEHYTPEHFDTSISARDSLMKMLSKTSINGHPYDTAELAQLFGIKPNSVRERFRQNGETVFVIPEIKTEPVLLPVRSFFRGLALGEFRIEDLEWSGRPFRVVETQTKKPKQRAILENTLGTWGTVRKNQNGLKIYLNPEEFGFLASPLEPREEITEIFQRPYLFPNFMLGMLLTKLSERTNRISSPHNGFLERVHKRAEVFGIPTGRISHEARDDNPLTVLHFPDPGLTFGTLIQKPSVQKLPFFRGILAAGNTL